MSVVLMTSLPGILGIGAISTVIVGYFALQRYKRAPTEGPVADAIIERDIGDTTPKFIEVEGGTPGLIAKIATGSVLLWFKVFTSTLIIILITTIIIDIIVIISRTTEMIIVF